MKAEHFYILIDGKLRIEKEVEIQKMNFWPIQSKGPVWEATSITKRVLFKI